MADIKFITKIHNRHVDDEGRLSHFVVENFGWDKDIKFVDYVSDLYKILQHFDFLNPNGTSDEDDAKAREWTQLHATKLSSEDIQAIKNDHIEESRLKMEVTTFEEVRHLIPPEFNDFIKQFLIKNATNFTTNNEEQIEEIKVDHVLKIKAEAIKKDVR